MSLIQNAEQSVLLDEKNILREDVVQKYHVAGQICQTALKHALRQIQLGAPIGKICLEVDSIVRNLTAKVYEDVKEKGIAEPTTISIDNVYMGSRPEGSGSPASPGSLAKISFGAHIDGYTAKVAHTAVVQASREGPVEGDAANVVCASHFATEAAVQLLAQGHGRSSVLRDVVERAAAAYGCSVIPGTRIRRIRRFLVGQSELSDESGGELQYKGMVWPLAEPRSEGDDDDDDVVAEAGEVWLVDVRVAASKSGKQRAVDEKARVYCRDFGVHHDLKVKTSRTLLGKIDKAFSVYPFSLDAIDMAEKDIVLGLSELTKSGLVVAEHAKEWVAPKAVTAREMTTIALTGKPLRLTGGSSVAAPAWVHSVYDLNSTEIMSLIDVPSYETIDAADVPEEALEVGGEEMTID
ncbi:hypothetical protein CANCADRAFT_107887 [Tortispora caseinolytica NRRL Y-17796]|uniref:Probable metalloprotease ARX1 n=1 Tax=Tortispora caseinolytica NRRL Y-17796 TaxID=767744 RepID=A0A1E4TFK9_9ASCO|nr:hypothetical protein CANCADRAFT_107887 [Tortispora caseinolytica NRRL Y-17796]